MKILSVVVGAALVSFAAHAQSSLDVAKISCRDYLFDKIAPPKSIAVWLSGYYNGQLHNTVVDLNRMDQNIDKVEDYCRLHLDMPFMDAAKATLGAAK